MQYRTDAPAAQVDAALRETLEEIHRTEGHAVLWFAEVHRRRLFRDLGYGSIHQYAEDRLGFSRKRTAQFLRLAESLDALPLLRESLIEARTTWTKLRTVIRYVSSRTEPVWRERLETMSRRDLEQHITRLRTAAARQRKRRGQVRLSLAPSPPAPARGSRIDPAPPALPLTTDQIPTVEATEPKAIPPAEPTTIPFDDETIEREAVEIPVTVSLRLSPIQAARYEALREKARKLGMRQEVAELLLAGFEEIVEKAAECSRVESQRDREATVGQAVGGSLRRAPRGAVSAYEIHVAVCPDCERGRVETNGGSRTIGLPLLRAAACDARVRGDDGRNRSTIPPRVRRAVLDRDGHRCRAAACRATRFLEVHHRVPRSRGGSNHPDNLITLCSACHQATHTHEPGDHPLAGWKVGDGNDRPGNAPRNDGTGAPPIGLRE